MNRHVLIKIAGPMVVVSLLLLAGGITAAWVVQRQQQESSDLIRREVHGMLAVEDVFHTGREIRRELDLYLRSNEDLHPRRIEALLKQAKPLIDQAKVAARTPEEFRLVEIVDRGYDHFLEEYARIRGLPPSLEAKQRYASLCDDLLSNEILAPARDCIEFNRQVVDRTTEASLVTAQHVRMGFLLLGITGSVAGLLIGLGMARAVSRSFVQLDVRVRGVTGRLSEVSEPVEISHFGNLQGLETGFQRLEEQIGRVVHRLRSQESELARSEQLAIVGQLAAGLAHEMRNPLMPVKVLVQSALSRDGETSLNRRQLQIINDELIRLEESIQSFLDFARPPELQMLPLDLKEVVYQALDLAFPKAHLQEVELRCVVPSRRCNILGDRVHLKQLLLNLILNSLDVLPDGGLIEVELAAGDPTMSLKSSVGSSAMSSEHDALRMLSRPDAMTTPYRIHVRDTGPGFEAEVLERLFEPFMTTKDTGTGLGLTICRRIAQAHGGDIRAANRMEGGAVFTIDLPPAADALVQNYPDVPTPASA